jgi:hypothetical protein
MTDQGGYEIEDDPKPNRASESAPGRSPGRAPDHAPNPASAKSRADSRDQSGREGHHEGPEEHGDQADQEDDFLPPPISPEADPKIWFVIAGVCTAMLAISWLAGARQLSPIEYSSDGATLISELHFGQRIAGLARTLVFLPLSTLAIAFGMLALAFVRQRPIGDVVALFARCAAIASIGMLVWLAPIEIRFIKQAINLLGPPLVTGALTIPIFKLSLRDATLTTGYAIMGIVLLTLFALVIVWAVGA